MNEASAYHLAASVHVYEHFALGLDIHVLLHLGDEEEQHDHSADQGDESPGHGGLGDVLRQFFVEIEGSELGAERGGVLLICLHFYIKYSFQKEG